MRTLLIVSTLTFLAHCEGLRNFSGTEMYRCLECLCHARSGCWNRVNCARYSISFEYWKKARRPVLDIDDDPDSEQSYTKCMKNENCILNTISQYVDAVGHMDCNCDGEFDCKDRLAIHLFGEDCVNPNFGTTYAGRFNRCSQQRNLKLEVMKEQEGTKDCDPEMFP